MQPQSSIINMQNIDIEKPEIWPEEVTHGNKRFIFGDQHANFINWMAKFIYTGAIKINNEDWQALLTIYKKETCNIDDYKKIQDIVSRITINKDIQCTFLGDIIAADRGKHQGLGLVLFNNLMENGLNVELIMGDHDAMAIQARLKSDDEITVYNEYDNAIMYDINSGCMSKKEINRCIKNTLQLNCKLLSIATDINGEVILLSHGAVGINSLVIKKIAEYFEIQYKEPLTGPEGKENAITLVKDINDAWGKLASKESQEFKNIIFIMTKGGMGFRGDLPGSKSGRIKSLERAMNNSWEENISICICNAVNNDNIKCFACLVWSDDIIHEQKEFNIHGHCCETKNNINDFCIDTNIGKEKKKDTQTSGEVPVVFRDHLELKNIIQQNVLQPIDQPDGGAIVTREIKSV